MTRVEDGLEVALDVFTVGHGGLKLVIADIIDGIDMRCGGDKSDVKLRSVEGSVVGASIKIAPSVIANVTRCNFDLTSYTTPKSTNNYFWCADNGNHPIFDSLFLQSQSTLPKHLYLIFSTSH